MELLILGKPFAGFSESYRGTYRNPPHYHDDVPSDHRVNQLFLWYCAEGGELGVVHTLNKASEFVKALREPKFAEAYELIAITKGQSSPINDGEFLGFDVSASYYYSLLSWGLDFDHIMSNSSLADASITILKPILKLLSAHFGVQLNDYGLFQQREVAEFCMECMLALQHIHPGLWENEQVAFEVVGVWRLSP